MDPNLSLFLFKFKFIPHLDTFLFEMQNVTAACSTFLFTTNLLPIKNSYFNDYQGLSDVSKGSRSQACPPSFFQSNRPIKQHWCVKCLLNI